MFMPRARINYWTDVAALAAAAAVFATGLVLLLEFHVGPHGHHRAYGWGLSKLAWMNLHRWGAVAMSAAVVAHAALHWRAMAARLRRACRGLPGKATPSDLALYLGFAIAAPAGFAAWLVVPEPLHHFSIDVHNFSGLALLGAVVAHVRRHFRWLLR